MNSRIKVAVALAVVAVSATVFVASASAQMRGASFARGARPRISARLVGPRFGRFGFAGTPFGGFFPGYSYLPPYYYPGYDYEQYEPSATAAPAAPLVVVQSGPAPVPAPVPAQNPVESVVLENRGG